MKAPIAIDGIYLFFFALSSSELALLFLQGQGFTSPLAFPTIVAIVLMVFGILGSLIFHTNVEDANLTDKKLMNIGLGVLVALVGFILINLFVPDLSVAPASTINVRTFFGTFNLSVATLTATLSAFVFSVILIPTAEESFFRGFWGNLAIQKAGLGGGLLAQAVIFMVFHIPAYGYAVTTLGIIFGDGLVIAAIDVYTGSISTGLLAHIGNNALSFLVVTGAVVLPPLFNYSSAIGPLIELPILLSVLAYRKRKSWLSR